MQTVYGVLIGLGWPVAMILAVVISGLLKRIHKTEMKKPVEEPVREVEISVGGKYLMIEKTTTRKERMLYYTEGEGMYAQRALLRSVSATNGVVLESARVVDMDIITMVNIHELSNEVSTVTSVMQSNIMDRTDISLFNQVLKKNKDVEWWLYQKYSLIPMEKTPEKEPNISSSLN